MRIFNPTILYLLLCVINPVSAQDMSEWSDKTVCRLAETQGSEVYIAEAKMRQLTCIEDVSEPPISGIDGLNIAGFTTLPYKEIEGDVLNPDRGFYDQIGGGEEHWIPGTYEIIKPFKPPVKPYKFQLRRYATVYRMYFSLKGYEKERISDRHLQSLERLFIKAKSVGVTVIPRFFYIWDNDKLYSPSKETIIEHIDQLAPIVNKHKDSISFIEAGFLGSFGEWNEDQYGDQNHYHPFRKQILEILLKKLDKNIHIALRYPVDALLIKDRKSKRRIGLHHDGPNYQADIYPKYKAYQVTLHTPQGGEMCALPPKTTYSCKTMLKYFDQFNFDVLNGSDWAGSNSRFEKEGCLQEVRNRLGYRFVIRGTKFEKGFLSIAVENVGFGKSFKSRYLSMKIGEKLERTDIDVSNWLKGSIYIHKIDLTRYKNIGSELDIVIDDGVNMANETGNKIFISD